MGAHATASQVSDRTASRSGNRCIARRCHARSPWTTPYVDLSLGAAPLHGHQRGADDAARATSGPTAWDAGGGASGLTRSRKHDQDRDEGAWRGSKPRCGEHVPRGTAVREGPRASARPSSVHDAARPAVLRHHHPAQLRRGLHPPCAPVVPTPASDAALTALTPHHQAGHRRRRARRAGGPSGGGAGEELEGDREAGVAAVLVEGVTLVGLAVMMPRCTRRATPGGPRAAARSGKRSPSWLVMAS